MGAQQSGDPQLIGAYAVVDPEVGAVISGVVSVRDPELHEFLRQNSDLSEPDVRKVEKIFAREIVHNLGDDWEPTEYGKKVDDAIGRFVHRFLIQREP